MNSRGEDHPLLKDFPVNWDWSTRSNVIGPVKNQTDGRVSSWAFAVTSAIEAQYGLKYDIAGQFSVQQLLDCTNITDAPNPVDRGLYSIAQGGGIAWAKSYKYTGVPSKCYFNLTTPAVQTYGTGFEVVESEGS